MKQARGWAARVDRRLTALEKAGLLSEIPAPAKPRAVGLVLLADDLVDAIQHANLEYIGKYQRITPHMTSAVEDYLRWRNAHA